MEERRLPTADAAAMKKSNEDGDLESLRLKLIQAQKENKELRNRIIEQLQQQQVKQPNAISQDGPSDDTKAADAMLEELLRNRILELIKQTKFINQHGFDDMNAAQVSDAVFQRVRNRVIQQLKQSNGIITQRQLSDSIIQELGRNSHMARKIIRQNDYLKEELSSTADSAFNSSMAEEIKPGGAETSAEASEPAPGDHPADNHSGTDLLEGEELRGAVVSPHREPISSPPIQFHGSSFLSEALPGPIQFHGHPSSFPSEEALPGPIQFHAHPSSFRSGAMPPILFHGHHPPPFLSEALPPMQFHPPFPSEALPPVQFHQHHHPPPFLSEVPALPPIQFHHHPPPFQNEAMMPPDFCWAELGVDDDEDESDLTGFD